MRKALFALVILIQAITCTYLSSASECSAAGIAGTITDQSGAVLVEARVVLREMVTGIELESMTEGTGQFQFEQVQPGSYTVSVGADGFSEQSRPVILNGRGETARMDFVLNLGTLEAEVSVTANRGKRDVLAVALPTQSLNRNLIERTNPTSTGESMIQAIGVTPVGSGPYQMRPRLRGLDSSRILILVDGQRLNHARMATDRAGVEPSLIEPAMIEDIEIVSGTGTSLYGSDALAGTINIITRQPETSDKLKFRGALNGFFSANERVAVVPLQWEFQVLSSVCASPVHWNASATTSRETDTRKRASPCTMRGSSHRRIRSISLALTSGLFQTLSMPPSKERVTRFPIRLPMGAILDSVGSSPSPAVRQ